jgi:hypothetical protein
MPYRDERASLLKRIEELEQECATLKENHERTGELAAGTGGGCLLAIVIAVGLAAACLVLGAPSEICEGSSSAVGATTNAAREIRRAGIKWRAQHGGACPTVRDLASTQEPRCSARLVDAWGTPFLLTCDGEEITVWSAGPDGRHGTPDDIRR